MPISIVKRGGWELGCRKEEKGELASDHCNENGLEMTSESLSEGKESKGKDQGIKTECIYQSICNPMAKNDEINCAEDSGLKVRHGIWYFLVDQYRGDRT